MIDFGSPTALFATGVDGEDCGAVNLSFTDIVDNALDSTLFTPGATDFTINAVTDPSYENNSYVVKFTASLADWPLVSDIYGTFTVQVKVNEDDTCNQLLLDNDIYDSLDPSCYP